MNIDSICVQGGYTPGNGEPRQVPIIQSTTFKYETSEDMGKLFDLEASGYFYSRLQNPTCDTVARKICELEGGTAAMLTSSGQAANFFALFNICENGDHIVSSSTIYGGTFNLISVTMKKMGVTCTFVDPLCSEEELDKAFQPNTKAVFGETIANPALSVLDLEKFAKAAHKHGVPLIVDNTFATPIGCRPFEWGVDIVTHSTTKYMDGHGAAVGGAIVDSGNFDWMAHKEKFPGLCTPDDSYHGVTYAERFGKGGAFITKATVQLMRDFGSTPSPQSAFILNLGLESLHVRMKRHCENGLAVARFLEKHPKVSYVTYADLESSPYHAIQQKYLPNGTCGVVSFGLKGGREAASVFMRNLKMAAIETHVADARTCCLNPASSTHRQMTDEQLKAAGVPAELIRMSCGLESMEFSKTNVYSTVHVCWGAQAGLYYHYGIRKELLPEKMFGIFPHKVVRQQNPLVRGFDEEFFAPHSRHTGIIREDLEKVPEVRILAESEIAGPFLMSTDSGRQIFITGHPEYEKYTLDGEYRRDVGKGLPIKVPVNYYPEDDPEKTPLFRWRGHAHMLYENWLNYYVYQETPYDLGELDSMNF